MTLAVEKCFKLASFRGDDSPSFFHKVLFLIRQKLIRDLGIYVSGKLSWHPHISARMKKAKSVFHLPKRNFSYKLQSTCKLGLYKLLLLPVLTYGFYCASLSRADMKNREKFQNRVVQ